MTRVVVLTPEAFQRVAQELNGRRFIHTALADAGYVNLCLDAYGDWVAIHAQGNWPPGVVLNEQDLLLPGCR